METMFERVAQKIGYALALAGHDLEDGPIEAAARAAIEAMAEERRPSEFLLIRLPHADGGEVTVDQFEDSGALQDALLKDQATGWYADVLGLYRHCLSDGQMGKWWCGPWTGYAKRNAALTATKAEQPPA